MVAMRVPEIITFARYKKMNSVRCLRIFFLYFFPSFFFEEYIPPPPPRSPCLLYESTFPQCELPIRYPVQAALFFFFFSESFFPQFLKV